MNLCLDANLDSLRKLFKFSIKGKASFLSYQEAINLVTKDSSLNMNARDAVMCYGMSKMTVVFEMAKGPNPYKKMQFVEFLEFIGRVAEEKYKLVEDWPLYQKIERVLDELLPIVGSRRNDWNRKVEIHY